MPEPTLHQVRRHQRLKRIHAKAVAQSLWHGWRTRNMGRRHDFLDPPPCCRSAPFPDPPRGRIWIVLTSPKMEGVISSLPTTLRGKCTCRTMPSLRRFKVVLFATPLSMSIAAGVTARHSEL